MNLVRKTTVELTPEDISAAVREYVQNHLTEFNLAEGASFTQADVEFDVKGDTGGTADGPYYTPFVKAHVAGCKVSTSKTTPV